VKSRQIADASLIHCHLSLVPQ